MRPVYADFAAHPPRLGNAFAADADQPWPTHHGDHAILGSGADAVVGFDVDKGDQVEQVTLTVTALVSKRGPAMGFAPLTIDVNGHAVVERLTIPGGGDLPQNLVFAVPGDWLRPGRRNAVRVRSGQDAVTNLWLYRITLEEVFDRGAAERAMAADAARESVFTYSIDQRLPDDPSWTAGAPLRIYIDRGEQSLPAQLSWSRPDGFECAISFQSAMDGFSGYVRAADGTVREVRGQLTDRTEFREDAFADDLRTFDTQEGWGGRWHESGQLRLAVRDGGPAPYRLAWRDQRGNSAAINVTPGDDGFLGYYQRYNEGPIGYRGRLITLKPTAKATDVNHDKRGNHSTRADAENLGHELEQIGRHARVAAQHAADLVADWLKPRR